MLLFAQLLSGGSDGAPLALIVLAVVVFTSLAAAAIYVGFFGPRRSRRARDLQRADDAQESDPTNSLNPAERAANEATKWI